MKTGPLSGALSSHPVLKDAPPKIVGLLTRHAVVRRVRAGQLLCGSSERTGRVWFVLHGLLHSTIQTRDGSPVTVDVLKAGEIFGYLNCWMSEAHLEEVSGLVAAEVVGVPARSFFEFVAGYHPAANLLLRDTAERMRSLIRLRAISTEPARARIASVLVFLESRIGPNIPMTRPMLAMVAGLTTETVSRALAPLHEARVVDLRRGGIKILDPARLRALAGALEAA